ncbi:MAG: response regulator [Candidatus Omnitrophica bacterium]|nr:response regulator [Candidatus Omnitrophota bacterium]
MKKIFLVEDEKGIAHIVTHFLTKKGYNVDVAHTLPQAMDMFSSEHAIVLLDILLEGEKSFPLITKIKSTRPETVIIMVSAYDNDDNIREAKRLGADAFISKPVMIEQLEQFLLSKIHLLEKDKDVSSDN